MKLISSVLIVISVGLAVIGWRQAGIEKNEYVKLESQKKKTDSLNLVLLETISKSFHVIYYKDWMDSIILINVVYYPINNSDDTNLVAASIYPFKEVNTRIKRLNNSYIVAETIWPKPVGESASYKFVLKNRKTGQTIGFPSWSYDLKSEGKIYIKTVRINQ